MGFKQGPTEKGLDALPNGFWQPLYEVEPIGSLCGFGLPNALQIMPHTIGDIYGLEQLIEGGDVSTVFRQVPVVVVAIFPDQCQTIQTYLEQRRPKVPS